MPLISVIIPTYNRSSYLGATIASIINQTYSSWECIVVDDGSNDYTEELMQFYCRQDQRIKYYHRPVNKLKGANSCRNYGFEKSKGEFINWFDSDDLMNPDFLAQKLSELQNNQNAICCISCFQTFTISNGIKNFGAISNLGEKNIFQNICLQKFAVPTHGPLWRRSYLETMDLFREDLSISQDLEFHNRTLKNDELIRIINKPLFYLREGNKSITREFYKSISQHFNSYFIVRKKIISDYKDNKVITDFLKNDLMGMFRYLLTLKEYKKSLEILNFVCKISKPKDIRVKLKCIRVYGLFYLIKTAGRGETRLKEYLYL